MGLAEQLDQELKSAMKSQDRILLETIRMVRAQLTNARIAKGEDLTEPEIVEVLSKEAKRRRESIEMFQKGNREDLVQIESRELEIISKYMPKALTPEEVEQIISEAVAATGAVGIRDFGKVMGSVMPQIKGRAEGKQVQDLVRKKLS